MHWSILLTIEGSIPYEIDVSAATVKGKGEFSKKVFFTEESGK